MFDDFMENDEAWARCEAFWQELVRDIESSVGQEGRWEDWSSNRYANGTLMDREFRTMCSRRSPALARAMQLYQWELGDETPSIVAWVDRDEDIHAEIEEWPSASLTINIGLTNETAVVARELIAKWLTPSTTPYEMEKLIDRVAKPTNRSNSD